MYPGYLGMKIKSLRIQDNVTQPQLAEALGVGKSTVSMWEGGNRQPDLETLEKIADYFNVPIGSFFPDYKLPQQEKTAEDLSGLSDFEREVIRMLRLLSKDQQQAFLVFLKSLSNKETP